MTTQTVYAKQGAANLRTRQFCTMLFADAERTLWLAVADETLNEGDVVHLAGRYSDAVVTWQGETRPGTIDDEWEKNRAALPVLQPVTAQVRHLDPASWPSQSQASIRAECEDNAKGRHAAFAQSVIDLTGDMA